ncbi:MAG: hypothetical protein ACRETJ_04660 [Steroidobacteraceae bacterium]
MTVRMLPSGSIELLGTCTSSDAEPLLQLLLTAPDAIVDWRSCQGAHTAVVQVLMAARPRLLGPPAADDLERWAEPAIRHAQNDACAAPGGMS